MTELEEVKKHEAANQLKAALAIAGYSCEVRADHTYVDLAVGTAVKGKCYARLAIAVIYAKKGPKIPRIVCQIDRTRKVQVEVKAFPANVIRALRKLAAGK